METYGPEVCEIAAAAGLPPDPTQERALDGIFAIDRRGRPASFEAALIGPRQNFKTGTILMAELGWLFVTEERLVVHSAHELDTTEQAFNDLRNLIEGTPTLSRRLNPARGRDPGISAGNGRWAIELVDDRRVKYKARRDTAGRGLSGDKTVLDEGFAVTPAVIGSLYPVMATRLGAQVLWASSAGMRVSKALRDLRARGRVGDPRLLWFEYGDPDPGACAMVDCLHLVGTPGCRADDEELWRAINSAVTYGRIDMDTLRDFRRSMPAEEWCREFMVWWEDPPNEDGGSVIDPDRWAQLVNREAKQPPSAAVSLVVAPDRSRSAIGVAGAGRKGRTLVMVLVGPGTDWVVPRLQRLVAKRDVAEVSLPASSQAAVLVPELQAAGVEFEELSTRAMGRACSTFVRNVNGKRKRVEHVGQPELDGDVKVASTREAAGVEVWDQSEHDLVSLVAASTAAHRWSLLEDYDVMDSIG